MEAIVSKLNELGELEYQKAAMCLDINEQIAKLEAQRQLMTAEIDERIAELSVQVKTEVVAHGASVKGAFLHAVFANGRVSWDNKKLDGYSKAHPEILDFRKEGAPSVSLRKC